MISGSVAVKEIPEKKVKYRYDTTGRWFKGSLHLHTVSSDGHLTFDELVSKYSAEKFDFISVTDHWYLSKRDRDAAPLMVINGIEIDGYDNLGSYYHVLAIGARTKASNLTGNFIKSLRDFYSQGAVLIWAHPHWTGNSLREGMRHKFHGLEVYNHSSECENGSGYALSHWDGMLHHNPDFLGFATDDSHFIPGQPCWNGGWIMVNAAACTQQEILQNIRRGNFYSSQGPDFSSIEYGRNTVKVATSPVKYIRLIGPRRTGQHLNALDKEEPLRRAEFELPPDWHSARIEIEDAAGKKAWSNPLWKND